MPNVPFVWRRDKPPVDVLLDDEDVAWVLRLPSRRLIGRDDKRYATCTPRINGQPKRLLIARIIAGLAPGDPREVDHINGDSLDNRRANLRIVERGMQQQNLQPQKIRRGEIPSSQHRGVVWNAKRKRWLVTAQVCGDRVYGGSFRDEDEAARAAQDLRGRLLERAFATGQLRRPRPVPPLSKNGYLVGILTAIPDGHPESRKTHCDNGHEFTKENTKLYNGGWRRCRQCARDKTQRYRKRLVTVKPTPGAS